MIAKGHKSHVDPLEAGPPRHGTWVEGRAFLGYLVLYSLCSSRSPLLPQFRIDVFLQPLFALCARMRRYVFLSTLLIEPMPLLFLDTLAAWK